MGNPPQTPVDTARTMGGAFPGDTMQRISDPDGTYRYDDVGSEVIGLQADWLTARRDVDHRWIHEVDRLRWLAALEHSAAAILTSRQREIAPFLREGVSSRGIAGRRTCARGR